MNIHPSKKERERRDRAAQKREDDARNLERCREMEGRNEGIIELRIRPEKKSDYRPANLNQFGRW